MTIDEIKDVIAVGLDPNGETAVCIIKQLEERSRLLALLTLCRVQFGQQVTHGEDCTHAYEEDDETDCDCGALDFYEALNACSNILVDKTFQ